MLQLSNIQIKNFRSCRDVEVVLSTYTPLVGYNNGGKSTILFAIQWLLKASTLVEADFNDPRQPVSVTGHITGITSELLAQLDEKHRTRIQEYCVQNTLWIRRTQPTPGGSVKNVLLEVCKSDNWEKNPTGIEAAIKAIFPEPITIGAMEDVIEDVGKSSTSTTIGKLIAEVMEPVEQQHGGAITDAFNEIRRRLGADGNDRATQFVKFDEGANESLHDIFPGLEILLHIPSPAIRYLFRNGTIKIHEPNSSSLRDIQSIGHGAQRSIQMALVRYLAQVKFDRDPSLIRTLLLIDEPELYLHPQAIEHVRTALKALTEQGYQVIFATHSPMMLSQDDIANTLMICKSPSLGTFVRKRLKEAIAETISDAPSQARVLFELGNFSQILFSERVLLVEGETERKVIPLIFQLVNNRSLQACKISLVAQGGGSGTVKFQNILSAIGIPNRALVDLDFAFRDAPRSNLIKNDDPDIIACRDIFGSLSEKYGISLADDGFPQRGYKVSVSEAWKLLGANADAQKHITSLHNKLLSQNIWVWTKGNIEVHLGIKGKNEENWTDYCLTLRQNGLQNTVEDYDTVVAFIKWIEEN